jgi:hypothetical protein
MLKLIVKSPLNPPTRNPKPTHTIGFVTWCLYKDDPPIIPKSILGSANRNENGIAIIDIRIAFGINAIRDSPSLASTKAASEKKVSDPQKAEKINAWKK